MENLKASMDNFRTGKIIKALYNISIIVCAWAYSLDYSTTYSLQPLATSNFGAHSSLLSLSIATSIMSPISQSKFAKFSDLISKTFVYVIAVLFYTVGYIIFASSNNITAYIAGMTFAAVGKSGFIFKQCYFCGLDTT